MQPQEPVVGPVPQPPQQTRGSGSVMPPGPPPPTGKPRARRGRLILAILAGVLGLLCLGGVGVFVSLYDEATEIKRTAPDAVVDNFLRAYLVNRDDNEAALYQCKSGGDFSNISAFRSDIVSRESQYSIGIRVTWTSLTVVSDAGQTTVTTDIRRAISDGSERTTDTWRFTMVDKDGWRVCGASQVR